MEAGGSSAEDGSEEAASLLDRAEKTFAHEDPGAPEGSAVVFRIREMRERLDKRRKSAG